MRFENYLSLGGKKEQETKRKTKKHEPIRTEEVWADMRPSSLHGVSTFGFVGKGRGLPCLGRSTVGIGLCRQLE